MASQQKLHSFKMTALKLAGNSSHKMSIMFMYVVHGFTEASSAS